MLESLPQKVGGTVFLGDSLTAECEWAELLQNDAIVNRGLGSDTAEKLFLMLGVGDLARGSNPDAIAANIAKIVAAVRGRSHATAIYVQSVLPVREPSPVSNAAISETNCRVSALAKQTGVEYVALSPAFSDSRGRLRAEYTLDGVHLNGAGYAEWGRIIAPLVR